MNYIRLILAIGFIWSVCVAGVAIRDDMDAVTHYQQERQYILENT